MEIPIHFSPYTVTPKETLISLADLWVYTGANTVLSGAKNGAANVRGCLVSQREKKRRMGAYDWHYNRLVNPFSRNPQSYQKGYFEG